MFLLLSTITGISVAALIAISHGSRQYGLRGSVLNPIFFLAVISSIYWADFIFLYHDALAGEVVTIRGMAVTNPDDVLTGFGIFAAGVAALALGIGLFHLLPRSTVVRPQRRVTSTRVGSERASLALSIGILLVSLPIATVLARDSSLVLSAITANRQAYFSTHQIEYFILSLNLPAAIYLVAARRSRARIPLIGLHLACLILLGGRAMLAYVAMAWLLRRIVRGVKVPAISALYLVPIAFFLLAVTRYVFRESTQGVTLMAFLSQRGGPIANAFAGIEISMSHALSTIAQLYPGSLSRWPFESFVGALLYPVPRAILSWKPVGASTQFSMFVHPEHWAQFQSETVISGFGDVYLMFGSIGSLLMVMIGFAVAYIMYLARAYSPQLKVVTITYLCINILVFVRADIYNMAPNLWGLASFAILFALLSRLNTARFGHFPRNGIEVTRYSHHGSQHNENV